MKNTILYFFVFTGATLLHFDMLCMEQNNHIGDIDKLMLLHETISKSKKILLENINNHPFETEKPFRIKRYCSNDGSKLSYEAFSMMRTQAWITSHNPLNQRSYSIDHCTTIAAYYKDGDLEVVARFYNKEALIKEVNALQTCD